MDVFNEIYSYEKDQIAYLKQKSIFTKLISERKEFYNRSRKIRSPHVHAILCSYSSNSTEDLKRQKESELALGCCNYQSATN